MRFRDRPLLFDGLDADLYVSRPPLEQRLLEEASSGRNLLLTGSRGSGKTTALRVLARDLRQQGRETVLVGAGVARSASDLLALIAYELDLPPVEPNPNLATPVVTLVRAVRHLAAAPARTILLVDPVDVNMLFELFGRLREEMWALPHQWIVEIASEQVDSLRQPPVDAFFSSVVEVPPLNDQQIQEFLTRGLEQDELGRVLNHLSLPLTGFPRDIVRFARGALNGTLQTDQAAAHRRGEIAARMGRAAHMALTEIEARETPVASSDQAFLERMGWTRPHAARVFVAMERAGVLRGFNDTSAERPGRPVKLYTPNPTPPAKTTT